jgi:hypothetical protein
MTLKSNIKIKPNLQTFAYIPAIAGDQSGDRDLQKNVK